MKNLFSKFGVILALGMIVISCDKKDSIKEDPNKYFNSSAEQYFNVAYCVSSSGNTATYVRAFTDLKSTDNHIHFNRLGFEVPSTRTARIYASENGKSLYISNYGGGTASKYNVISNQVYDEVKKLNIGSSIGTEYFRWTKFNDNNALAHNVTKRNLYDNPTDSIGYQHTEATAYLLNLELGNFSVGTYSELIFPRSDEDNEKNLNAWRMDAPVINGGKAYYGVAKQHYDPETNKTNSSIPYQASTFVVDYPSLKNPAMVSSAVTTGSTYGYRITVSHIDENGDIYQMTDKPSHILKITDGKYDDSYVFNLSTALGFNVGARGWFYTGDGIGYAVFYDADKGVKEEEGAWGVARVDIRNKTAIKMNIPGRLWMQQYQSAKMDKDGKLYMAIAPVGGNGNIYIFDPTKADANGFEVGASLFNAAGAFYIGVF